MNQSKRGLLPPMRIQTDRQATEHSQYPQAVVSKYSNLAALAAVFAVLTMGMDAGES